MYYFINDFKSTSLKPTNIHTSDRFPSDSNFMFIWREFWTCIKTYLCVVFGTSRLLKLGGSWRFRWCGWWCATCSSSSSSSEELGSIIIFCARDSRKRSNFYIFLHKIVKIFNVFLIFLFSITSLSLNNTIVWRNWTSKSRTWKYLLDGPIRLIFNAFCLHTITELFSNTQIKNSWCSKFLFSCWNIRKRKIVMLSQKRKWQCHNFYLSQFFTHTKNNNRNNNYRMWWVLSTKYLHCF